MNPIPVEAFAQIVGGKPHGFPAGSTIAGFATDNRDVNSGDLFLAIKGARVDGHNFVADATLRGAVGALVERTVEGPHILVDNLVDALARLGRHFRAQFDGPVIGITGSAGKTTAKEFIAAALSSLGPILKTEGNKNTEYTAPLTWTALYEEGLEPPSPLPPSSSRHDHPARGRGCAAVVVEMAMRGFGQIKHLAEIAKPTVAVITNIGFSHMSEVGSREGIAQAKAELLECLPEDGIAVLWQEDPYLHYLKSKAPGRVLSFGYSDDADCRITQYKATSWTSSTISGTVDGVAFHVELPTVGRHIALGAAAAIAVAFVLGVAPQDAADAVRSVRLPPMRMEVLDLNGATILLDTYNAAPPSMLAAIETFAELPCEGRRLAVIGEMRELGDYSEQAHRELGTFLATKGIDEIMFYSGPARLAMEEARMHGMVAHWANSLDEVAAFLREAKPGDAILIKGSRSLELENAVQIARQPIGAGC